MISETRLEPPTLWKFNMLTIRPPRLQLKMETWAQLFKKWITAYSLDKSLFSTASVFCLMFLARFLHRPMIHILLPSFFIRFIWLYRVFLTYFIYWIAAYPVYNAIHPLNKWPGVWRTFMLGLIEWYLSEMWIFLVWTLQRKSCLIYKWIKMNQW